MNNLRHNEYKTVYTCPTCKDSFWLWKNAEYEVVCKKCNIKMVKELYEVLEIDNSLFWQNYSANFPVSAYGVWSPVDIRRIYPEENTKEK